MLVKFKKENQNVSSPYLASEGSAGFDLVATKVKRVGLFLYKYEFGLAFEIPVGYEAQIRPRSSVYKTGMLLSNSLGTIDSDFRGYICAFFWSIPFIGKKYKVGDRIAQIVFNKVPVVFFEEVKELSETKRGSGGFGSTGK